MKAIIEIKGLECTECCQFSDGQVEITETGDGYIDAETQTSFVCHKCGHKQYVSIKTEVEYG